MSDTNTVGLIPARLESTRLARKLLLAETGQPLIQYVWEVAVTAGIFSEVIVATDSGEIADAVSQFGGRAEMTGDHPSGTDRIAEVVRRCCPNAPFVVNLQGDEPELEPETLSRFVGMIQDSGCEMATVATPLCTADGVRDPSCVKVVVDDRNEALYFSRAPIPFVRDQSIEQVLASGLRPWLLHLGLYAYRTEFLLHLTSNSPGRLEQLERLEQLRAVGMAARIAVMEIPRAAPGIDTPEDYRAFVERVRRKERP